MVGNCISMDRHPIVDIVLSRLCLLADAQTAGIHVYTALDAFVNSVSTSVYVSAAEEGNVGGRIRGSTT